MASVHVNGIDIYYETHGPSTPLRTGLSTTLRIGSGPGKPLVLTHGFAGPVDNWRPEVLPLAAERTLVLYDVRGHGRTSAPRDPSDYSMPVFAADLAALLEAIGVQRAHIGGVSMGGMISAQFAVNYPEMCESLLLCDTTCGNAADSGPAGEWERRLLTGIPLLCEIARNHGLEETLRREHEWKKLNDPHLSESPYPPGGDYERIKLMTVEGYLGAAHAIITRPDLTDRIGQIKAPTLVMAGEWDDFLPCALRDHGLIPGSRLVIRRRCAHGSRWRLDTFLSEVRAFLADVEALTPVAGRREV